MSRIVFFILFLISYSNCNAQFEDSYQETGILSDANYNLIEEMVNTFENQLCEYYNTKPENANKAFYTYIQDLKNDKIDIKKLTSDKTDELLNKSIKNHLEYIWITNKNKRTRWNLKNLGVTEIKREEPKNNVIRKFIQRLKASENILSIDYQTDFADNLMNNTYIEDLKDIIYTLKDKYGSDPPHLIASGLSGIGEEDFNDHNLKTFIAFELFYATLNANKNE